MWATLTNVLPLVVTLHSGAAVALDGAPPRVSIATPADHAKVPDQDFPLVVRGTVEATGSALHDWQLTLCPVDDARGCRPVSHGTAPVADGALGTLRLGGPLHLALGRPYALHLDAEDVDGRTSKTTVQFKIPRLLFARIPLPDQYDQGSYNVTISADGRRIGVQRSPYVSAPDSVWLYDALTREMRQFANSDAPALSSDGVTFGYLPYKVGYHDGTLLNLDTGQFHPLSYRKVFFPILLDAHATQLFYVNPFATPDNPDAGEGAFVYSVAADQLTRISQGPVPQHVQELAISSSGPYVAFTSPTPFDPTASTGDKSQIFLYDQRDTSLRQLTNRVNPDGGAALPELSADGSTLAYTGGDGAVHVVNLPSGTERFLLDVSATGDGIGNYYLSADGNVLAFVSSADLDPRVGNEDHNAALFRLDLTTGIFEQVTDTTYLAYLLAVDATASTFCVEFGGDVQFGSDRLTIGGTRVIPRRHLVNHPPTLAAPQIITAHVGSTSPPASFNASDTDGDPITFYAEVGDPLVTNLDQLSSSLVDHGDGTAQFTVSPGPTQSGYYRLHVAAFDEAGGVTQQTISLVIEDTHPTGDVNCDGQVNRADVPALLALLFDPGVVPACVVSGDLNADGVLSVADAIALLSRRS